MAPLLASSVPRVGVAVFVLQASPVADTDPRAAPQDRFLLGQRLGSHGAGTWALPGGHLEFGEDFETCAAREVLEETGLDIYDVRFLTATNDVMPLESGSDDQGGPIGKHYVTIFMTARVKARQGANETMMPEAKLMEPNKCAGWEWVRWEDLVEWARQQQQQQQQQQQSQQRSPAERTVHVLPGGLNGRRAPRSLFSPMIDLLVQRPNQVPRIA